MIHACLLFCLRVADFTFGWTLSLPRDASVILIGALLGLLLFIVRRLSINPGYFLQIQADEHRLQELIRAARLENALERLARFRSTLGRVRVRKARAEFASVCVSLLVLLTIMEWGHKRLEYLPLKVGEFFQFRVRLPASAVAEVIHVVPQVQLTSNDGWIRLAVRDGKTRPATKIFCFRFKVN